MPTVNAVPACGVDVEGAKSNELSTAAGTVTGPLGALVAVQVRNTAVTV
ncbi:MAG: hypothetical protein ABSC34_06075 [Acidimicrobiales bacterium]